MIGKAGNIASELRSGNARRMPWRRKVIVPDEPRPNAALAGVPAGGGAPPATRTSMSPHVGGRRTCRRMSDDVAPARERRRQGGAGGGMVHSTRRCRVRSAAGTMQEPTIEALTILVNGRERRVAAPPKESLLAVLRDRLELTGTKYGCGEGMCGACTVLLDGRAVRSCRTPVSAAAGKQVTTIEGLERDGQLHPVQQAFLEAEAFQCGYCTPGMIVAAVALLGSQPNPSAEEIAARLAGNVCRCGTYPRIVQAVGRAAGAMRRGRAG
jgi:aerobic-type carbon monoxide dehydrogenase small subunit (CoxS/CutS family)